VKSRLFPATLLSLLLFVTAATPSSLSVTGTIKGKVTDADGQPLPDVKITLLDAARGQTYTLKTDKKGNYYMMGIAPADYRLKLEKTGFQVLEGRVSIMPDRENVFDAVLAPEAKQIVKPGWEDANIRANELFKEGRYEEAVASFREAVRLKPDFFDAYANLANAYGKLKRFEEAIPIFEEAVRACPENAGLYSSLGLLYLNAGQGIKAVESLEKAAAIDPQGPFSYYSLGIAYTQTGEFEKAVANYEKYIALITDAKEIERVKGVIEQLKSLAIR